MPGGKIHFRDSLIATGVVAATTLIATGDSWQALGYTGGAIIGTYLTPDLDLAEKDPIYPNWALRKFPVINGVHRGIGFAYGSLMSHRGVSHAPVVGTLTKMIPIFAVIVSALWLLGIHEIPWILTIRVFFGWTVVDFVHIAHDRIHSYGRRRNEPRR